MSRIVPVLLWLGLLAAGSALAVPTRVTVNVAAQSKWGHPGSVQVTVSYQGPACPTNLLVNIPGTLTLKRDAVALGQIPLATNPLKLLCLAGDTTYSGNYYFSGADVPFGSYQYIAEYSGGDGFDASASSPVAFTVVPEYTLPTAGGSLKIGLSGHDAWACSGTQVQGASLPAAAPAGLAFPYGGTQVDLTPCTYNCGFLCPPNTPKTPWHDVLLEMPAPVAANASVWIYGPGAGQETPAWRRVTSRVDGARVSFQLAGNAGPTLKGYIAIATGAPDNALQDLWWGGPAQNGWGFSIAQSGEQMFGGLYVYRDDGRPVWVMMPGGTWNADHTVFTGALYSPHGSWLGDYKPGALLVGSSLGTGKLTFAGNAAATFDYAIGGATGRQALQRFALGPAGNATTYSGMWWGGDTENGWGLYLAQSGNTLFGVWYTYDSQGVPVWYVMTEGTVGDAGGYTFAGGTLYRTSSAPWLGTAYDATRFQGTAAGTLSLEFWGPDIARMTYVVEGVQQAKPIYRFPF